jgi:putative oxygen-independent coproporphyrinogen III oxidase
MSAPPPPRPVGALPSLPPLSLYIHIPWCVRKCPYCDFNSHRMPSKLPQDDYVAALLRDLEQDLPRVWGRPVSSIFFGGGTPSLFDAAHIGAILDGVGARLSLRPALEVTLETNPGTVEHDRFEAYRAAGVNRLSFGVQSFDDGCLDRLGRIHDSAQAEAAVRMAQDAGFDDINLDLMYALPGQDQAMALADIERAIALKPSHISHYQLTLEPNTPFHATPPPNIPDDDEAWTIQQTCQQRLAAAGYAQYEISAYARPDRQCAHNLNYWRFGDYLGIGAGAHGKLSQPADEGILRRAKPKNPRSFLEHAGTPKGIAEDHWIAFEQRPFEFMLNLLRLHEGFTLDMFEARTGLPREQIAAPIADACRRGWLQHEGERIRPTDTGLRFLNDIIMLFMA